MKKLLIIISLFVLCLFSFTSCCKKCCSPSIEVGLSDPGEISHYCKNFEIWTWEPITLFPRNPNIKISGSELQPLRPYLAKAMVTNYSDEEVRGVTVVFYWASFGLFDQGTPIGAVAVDLPANSSEWVSSPWSFTLGETKAYHLCLSVRVFHPCDTELKNNYCWRNLLILRIPWPFKFYAMPFIADFSKFDGRLALKIAAPEGIRAHIVPKPFPIGELDTLEEIKVIKELDVRRGVPQELSLVIENVGADFNLGDTFDVKVVAIQEDIEVSSFTVRFEISEKQQ